MDAILRPPAEPATIMLVEDAPATRHMLSELLTALGHGVVTAESAETAVVLLDAISPDLVLTDVHMGAMSGIELCARMKSDPRYELTPVVVLTAIADVDARVAGLAAGADDFAKPVDFNELGTRLRALLRVKALLGQLERAEGSSRRSADHRGARPVHRGALDRLRATEWPSARRRRTRP